jgi:ribosomal protein S18 acetylase RimI-like enzyme
MQQFATPQHFEMRRAEGGDAALIARHRNRMFVDSGYADEARGSIVAAAFEPWVRPRLEEGSYLGWLASPEGQPEQIVAGAGMMLMEFPPHFLDTGGLRAYLLNFYVEPEYRGHGLAQRMLKLATDEAERRGIRVVSLHASPFGRPIYEKNGFEASNEMLLVNGG